MQKLILGLACTMVTASTANAGLITGLTHYWDFDHSGGTTLDDAVGANDGTLQGYGTPNWIAGRFGNALTFDGGNDQVSLGSMTVAGNTLSIGGWVHLNRLPSASPSPFEGIFDSNTDAFVLYADRGNQELRFKVTDQQNDAARPGIGQGQLSTGIWMHVLGVYDGANNRASIYLNGVLVDQHVGSDFTSGPLTGDILAGQSAFFGSQGGQYFLSGALDDFAIWNRTLTSQEISQLQTASVGQLTTVPEPSSLLVFGVGITVSCISSRRRR